MGFNKSYLDRERLINIYESSGKDIVILTIKKSDCIISMDDFTREVVKCINEGGDIDPLFNN